MAQMAERTDREAHAVQLALAGRSYDAIARELGYANRSGAWKAVRRALARDVVDGVREVPGDGTAPPGPLQVAHWDRAMEGDIKAVGVVLRVINQRIRLLGLDRVAEEIDKPPVLVIGGTPERHMAGLQRIIDGV